jgi:hypothetical protein
MLMSLDKESIRALFKWVLKNSKFDIFLNLRLLNKYSNRIGTQEFNIAMKDEKIIIGRSTFVLLNTCNVCGKKYNLKTEKEKLFVSPLSTQNIFNKMYLVYCNSLKCKMKIISSINKMIKEGFLSLLPKEEKYVIVKRTNGNIENDWTLELGIIDNYNLFINVFKIGSKDVPWENLKELNPKLKMQFKRPFLMDEDWINKIIKNNTGIEFNKEFTLETKYHPN